MSQEIEKPSRGRHSPFEQIKRTNEAGLEFWSSRDFAEVLGYDDYRNFERVVEKAKLACFNSGHRIEDHFVDVTEMVTIGSGAERPVKTILLSRYACYLRPCPSFGPIVLDRIGCCSCRACSAVLSSKLDHYKIDPMAQTMDKAYLLNKSGWNCQTDRKYSLAKAQRKSSQRL